MSNRILQTYFAWIPPIPIRDFSVIAGEETLCEIDTNPKPVTILEYG